jgi:hypothetical protein
METGIQQTLAAAPTALDLGLLIEVGCGASVATELADMRSGLGRRYASLPDGRHCCSSRSRDIQTMMSGTRTGPRDT